MAPSSRRHGRLFIISAPSGAGKSTLCAALRNRFTDLGYSISFTTRQPRGKETDGREYHFISESEFRRSIENGGWAEWAQVHGNYYGTSAEALERMLATGRDVLLDIDVQGADQLFRKFPESVGIFIMPPDMETLRERLTGRNTDSPEVIERRLEDARDEIAEKEPLKDIIVNEELSKPEVELLAIVDRFRFASY